jgi:three-Cys-motif partner protein
MYWIYPFQLIASKHFDSFCYIDLFAGSGLMKAENSFFVGSPIVAVSSTLKDKKFSKYVCAEFDQTRKAVLEKRLEKACSYYETCKAVVIQGDTNEEIESILKEDTAVGRTCFLAFVDVQKYTDFKWKTLETLMKHGTGDIIFNFPTMSISRNLGNIDCISSLSKFFGDSKWLQYDLNDADGALEYFKTKVRMYRSEVDSVEVKGDNNNRLYDLVFATGSKGMLNVLNDLKKRLDAIRTKDIKGLYSVVAEGQMQMKDFLKLQ